MNQLINLIIVFLMVAFLTLMERKILASHQLRVGPNKISLKGLLQPIADAIKLLSKSNLNLIYSNSMFYLLNSILMFGSMCLIWTCYSNNTNGINYWLLSVIIFICLITISTYFVVFLGWSSNSKYGMLGSLRSVAQTISYEIMLLIMILIVLIMINTYNYMIYSNNYLLKFMLIMLISYSFIFYNSIVCELNRAPFDLSEGESELVSGFNTEFGGIKFTLIFLTEYSMMIFMSYVFVVFFFNNYLFIFVSLYILVWLRSSFPRLRYDMLMFLVWKHYLIFSIILSMLVLLLY